MLLPKDMKAKKLRVRSIFFHNKILDNKGQVDTFILDFEKAFDTPPHELKSKLFSYGIGDKTLKWINAFLCYRQQRVVGGRTGIVVRASDSGSEDPGSILGRVGLLFP